MRDERGELVRVYPNVQSHFFFRCVTKSIRQAIGYKPLTLRIPTFGFVYQLLNKPMWCGCHGEEKWRPDLERPDGIYD